MIAVRFLPILLVLALAATASLAAGSDPQPLVKEKGCMTCHDMSAWKAGPPLKSVAAKYRSNRAAGEQRITAMLKDGVGHAKADATPAEIQSLIDWVLSE